MDTKGWMTIGKEKLRLPVVLAASFARMIGSEENMNNELYPHVYVYLSIYFSIYIYNISRARGLLGTCVANAVT